MSTDNDTQASMTPTTTAAVAATMIVLGAGIGITIGAMVNQGKEAKANVHEAVEPEPLVAEVLEPIYGEEMAIAERGTPMPSQLMTNDCLACHQVAIKIVGPSYNQVADKYQGQPGMVRKLARKVMEGGSGVWGEVPMAPHLNLSFSDAQTMTSWILGQTTSEAPSEPAAATEPDAEESPTPETTAEG